MLLYVPGVSVYGSRLHSKQIVSQLRKMIAYFSPVMCVPLVAQDGERGGGETSCGLVQEFRAK